MQLKIMTLIRRTILNIAYYIFFLHQTLANIDYFYYFRQIQHVPDNLRIPKHIAMAFTNESHQLDLDAISEMISWCKRLGIKYITLFDDLGRIKLQQKELFRHLEHHMSRIGYEKPVTYVKGLNILSRRDGRQRFVEDIKHLLRFEPERIDLELVNKQVGWTTDPELLISFGNHVCLHGFPPWQLRLTEIFYIPTHRRISQQTFVDCLHRYSRTIQRLGA